MRFLTLIFSAFLMAGCGGVVITGPSPTSPSSPSSRSAPATRAPSQTSLRMFQTVVRRVEPVAERECRERTRGANCDFRIIVDDRPGQPPNAFQTLDRSGRPIIGFTVGLIRDAENADELAFVLGHEASHHIRGHIPQTQQRAMEGALLGTVVATVLGGSPESIEAAQQIGGTVGARRFAKDFELEADSLGTVIAARAGYNPVRGAQYFARIPDPGNQFLGTHPPNADRIATVRRVAAGL
jgi:predicted Zn-dependent protease